MHSSQRRPGNGTDQQENPAPADRHTAQPTRPHASIPAEKASKLANDLSKKRALVIDDDASCRRLLAVLLSREGYDTDEAENGKIALDKLEQGEYDLIIADIHMPQLGGQALYAHLRSCTPHLARRIVFVTGDTVNEHVSEFLKSVSNPCLIKPFDLTDFSRIVREV